MTNLEKYEKVNSWETIEELIECINCFSVNNEIQGRTRKFNATEMMGMVGLVVRGLITPNVLTREWGIRHQEIYLNYYYGKN